MREFLKCVAEAVIENGIKGLASLVPGGEFAYKVAEGAYKKYRDRKKEADQPKEIEALAQTNFESAKQEAAIAVREAVAEVAKADPQRAELSLTDRLQLEMYLSQVPATVQQSLKRPEDPNGRTVPAAFALGGPDAVVKLLPPRAPRFKPGDALAGKPGWVLDRPLGVGGFGEVWLARHEQLTSLLGAVKFCFGQQARDLQHESGVIDRVMQAGQHPNIVPLLDVSFDGAAPWIMYEYVQGGDLGDWIRALQLRTPEERCKQAVAGLRQIASAVAHFHKLAPPVVHRDLKPNNILLDRVNKRLRITDFGIGAIAAKTALNEEARGGTTAAGRMLSYLRGAHTPLYASPQQRLGSDPDPRDDVHALGVIAFQMLTGRLDAEVKGNWQKRLKTDGVPESLIDLIGNSTSDDPDDRPRNAQEWRDALPTSNPVTVTPPPTVPPPEDEEAYQLRPNAVAILKALKKRGATSAEKAVSKYLLMAEDGVGPHCYNLEDEGLIEWIEQRKSPVPHLTKSKWTLWITSEGLWAIDHHTLASEPAKSVESAESDEGDVWQGFWFVNVGESEWFDDDGAWVSNRNWEDCRKYGFLAAGYGSQYSAPLRKLEIGAKVFAYMKGRGYVGYGVVTKPASVARDFVPAGATQSLLSLPLVGKHLQHDKDDDEQAEWVVGIRWHTTFDRDEAKTFSGAFAGRLIVCKLRHSATVEYLRKEFKVAD